MAPRHRTGPAAVTRSTWMRWRARRGGRGPLTMANRAARPRGELPPAVASALIAELLALSPAGQLAARSAAVIGDPFCVNSVGQVSGLEADRAAAAIGELAAARSDPPDRADQAVRLPPRHRQARGLRERESRLAGGRARPGRRRVRHCGAPLTEQAYHIERAAEFGDLGAVGLLAEAAGAVQAQAPGTAAAVAAGGAAAASRGGRDAGAADGAAPPAGVRARCRRLPAGEPRHAARRARPASTATGRAGGSRRSRSAR